MSLFKALARFKWNFDERRRFVREQVDFPAWIDIGDGSEPLAGTVLDISEDGARIMVSAAAKLPNNFWLILAKDKTRRRYCRLAFRHNTQVGVQYIGPIMYDSFPPTLR